MKEKDILTLNAIVEEMRTRPTDEVHELEKKCAEVRLAIDAKDSDLLDLYDVQTRLNQELKV